MNPEYIYVEIRFFFYLGDIDRLLAIVKRKCSLGLKFSVVYATTVDRRIRYIISSLQTCKYFCQIKYMVYICYVIGAVNLTTVFTIINVIILN